MRKLYFLTLFCLVTLVSLVAMAAGEAAPELAPVVAPGIWDSVAPLLGPIATILLSLIGSVWAFLRTKVGKAIKGWLGEGWANTAFQATANLALELVLAAAQTTIKELEKSLADGDISKEELTAGKKKVGEAVLEKLREKTLGKLLSSGAASSTADAMDLTANMLESAVKKAKIGGAVAPMAEKPVNP